MVMLYFLRLKQDSMKDQFESLRKRTNIPIHIVHFFRVNYIGKFQHGETFVYIYVSHNFPNGL